MPEADDDRYDVLKDGVKALYEECKFEESLELRKAYRRRELKGLDK